MCHQPEVTKALLAGLVQGIIVLVSNPYHNFEKAMRVDSLLVYQELIWGLGIGQIGGSKAWPLPSWVDSWYLGWQSWVHIYPHDNGTSLYISCIQTPHDHGVRSISFLCALLPSDSHSGWQSRNSTHEPLGHLHSHVAPFPEKPVRVNYHTNNLLCQFLPFFESFDLTKSTAAVTWLLSVPWYDPALILIHILAIQTFDGIR